ncbi:MAG TPA: hypothetical protein VMV59_03955 [Candidatus Dormibacteraeota bacterium]|nr:hypothetical protein [Candidatus Dormibacteraeota bacterium]
MNGDPPKLGRTSAAFALSAAITILFNTVVACAKDAYGPLKALMASPSGSDWTTQGLADVILFFLLGAALSKTSLPEKCTPKSLTYFLAVAVMVAGVGLFVWYVLY